MIKHPFLLCFFFVVQALSFAFFMSEKTSKELSIAEAPISTTATVKRLHWSGSPGKGEKSYRYIITFDGKQASYGSNFKLEPGTTLPIVYKKGKPSEFIVGTEVPTRKRVLEKRFNPVTVSVQVGLWVIAGFFLYCGVTGTFVPKPKYDW